MKNKQRFAFTLAEVLITLAIIGVVAAMTIPTLMQSTQDQELKTGFKKNYADFSQSVMRMVTDNGGSIKGLFSNVTDMQVEFQKYFNYTKSCNGNNDCWHVNSNWWYLNKTPVLQGGSVATILANGSLIRFNFFSKDCTDTSFSTDLMVCGDLYFDTNGFKGPNTIGRDIYMIWITADGVKPHGTIGDGSLLNDCDAGGSGGSCAARYLYSN